MQRVEREWVDKLFACMDEFYGDRWRCQFIRGLPIEIVKTIWQSALTGLTYEEIRSALVLLKRHASIATSLPPHQLEFFRYAKKSQKPYVPKGAEKNRGNPDIAKQALNDINEKLRYKRFKEEGKDEPSSLSKAI